VRFFAGSKGISIFDIAALRFSCSNNTNDIAVALREKIEKFTPLEVIRAPNGSGMPSSICILSAKF
jgi:hypothetical protein